MPTTFLVVPQWQGSGSSRAMRLVDGAEAIRGDLPRASTVLVDVPLGAGNNQGTAVQRLSAIQQVLDATTTALEKLTGLAITIGGDCGVDLAGIGRANAHNEAMALVWLDAHADLNTPESSPSGAFHGMVVRTLLGDGPETLLPAGPPLARERLIYGGLRSLDDAEARYIDDAGIRVLAPDALDAKTIANALRTSGATSVYLHIDLDVLDPSEIEGIGYPEPFGVSLTTLLEVIASVKATLPLVGAAITEFAPTSPSAAADDLGSILRILGALTA